MDKRFEQNIGPISAREQAKLNRSKVFIAGCGGIGGYLLEHMVRAGIGSIICADGDRFEERDLNRQLLADESTLGLPKARCAAERARKIWPQIDIQGLDVYLDADNLSCLTGHADLVLDALDNAVSRKALAGACRETGTALAHGAVAGWRAQAALVRPGGPLYDILYATGATKQPEGALPFAAAAAAAMQAALAVGYLCGREYSELSPVRGGYAENGGREFIENELYIFDLRAMRMDIVKYS